MSRWNFLTRLHLWKMNTELEDYQSDLLSQSKRPVLELHLAECPECRAKIARTQRTAQTLIASRPESEAGASEDRIRSSFLLALKKSQSPGLAPRKYAPYRVYAMAGIAVLVCVAGLKFGLRTPENAVSINAPPSKNYTEKLQTTRTSLKLQLDESLTDKPVAALIRTPEKKPMIVKFRRFSHFKRGVASAASRRRKPNATRDTEMSDDTYALASKLWERKSDPAALPEAILGYVNDEPHLIVNLIRPAELEVRATVIETPNPALPAYVEAATLTSHPLGRSSWRLCRLIKNGDCITNETSEGESKWGEPISHLSLSITKLVPAAPGNDEAQKEMK